MFRRHDLRIGLFDAPVRSDEVRDSPRTLRVRTIAGPVGERDLAIRIAEERKTEIELVVKCCVLFRGVEADPQYVDLSLVECRALVAEPAPFDRSTRRVGFRIEPEQDTPAPQCGQGQIVALVGLGREVGSQGSGCEHGNLLEFRVGSSLSAPSFLAESDRLGRLGLGARRFSADRANRKDSVASILAVAHCPGGVRLARLVRPGHGPWPI